MMIDKIVLASNNQGKLSEFQTLFTPLNFTIVPQSVFDIQDAGETGLSFIENAIIKARHASFHSKLPAIADDSGLCVPVLDNKPGIYSARFAGTHGDDKANIDKLLETLQPFFDKGEIICAKFVCVLAFVRFFDDPLPIIAQGEWIGEICQTPQGDNGFGYDPVFWLADLQKTSAQLDKATKNQLSHRAKALQMLSQHLTKI